MTGTVTVRIRVNITGARAAIRRAKRLIEAYQRGPERRVESARRRRIDQQMAARDRRAIRAERRAS